MAAGINEQTVGGLLAYCDWLREKNYQSPGAVDAWKTAIKKVFGAVEGDAYEALSLDGLDLNEYVERFRIAAGQQYKSETVTVYGRRIKYAMDAHSEYNATGKQAILSRPSRAPKKPTSEAPKGDGSDEPIAPVRKVADLPLQPEFFEFNYPLSPGRVVRMELPYAMSRREIDRLCTVLQTLEEQPQLLPGTEAQAA